MRKQNSSAGDGMIAVAVSRLGSEVVPVTLPAESTVKDALDKAGVSSGGRSEYFVSGVRADLNDVLEDGDVLALVTPKQAGS